MKKILSLVLALLMMTSFVSMIGATEEVAAIAEEDALIATATEEEVATQFDEAIKFLQEYGIYKGKGNGNLGAADPIERYQMALFVSRISTGWVDDEQWKVWWVGTDATVAEEWYDREHDVTGFTDLEGTPATNYLGALSYAAQKGIILGYGDGKFGPTDGIRYEDALTMLCRVLEYNNLEWPWGYIEKAVNLGLTKGIPTTVAYRDRLNRGQVAQLIYNALFAQMKNGGTLASRYFNGALEWKNIIITGAGYGRLLENDLLDNGKLYDLGGKIAFRTVTELGELGTETYFVKNIEDLNWLDKRYERYVGYAYKALFTLDEKSNYVTLVHVKELYTGIKSNRGILALEDGKYPIAAFLEGRSLVDKFTSDSSYLNTITTHNNAYKFEEFILRNALQTPAGKVDESKNYAIDWEHDNNIVEYELKDGKVDVESVKTIWYYNSALKSYFKVLFDKDGNYYGIDLLDQDDIADILAKANKVSYKGGMSINKDPAKKTAYADLTYFTILDWDKPNYGLFEAYRLGKYGICTDAKDADGKDKAGFYVSSVNSLAKYYWDYGYPKDDAYINYSVGKTPTEGKGQLGWINDKEGLVPADGDFIIYNYDEATKELKVVKIISDKVYDENNYIGAGVLRGWKLADKKFNIDGKDYNFDYTDLLGNGLYIHDGDSTAEKNAFTNFFRGLFNQYVKFLVVDGKAVWMEKTNATNDVIVVDSYAGLSSDGYIVVNGYNTADLKYTQFKIGSYNGWVKGDYFYYPDNATVDKAFARGTVYKLTSIDKSGKDPIYYVYTIAQPVYTTRDGQTVIGRYDFSNLESAYVNDSKYPVEKWAVELDAGYKQITVNGKGLDGKDPTWQKAKSSDKYIFICNDDIHEWAPIVVYQGKGGNGWKATGTLVNGFDADDAHVVVDARIVDGGFDYDQWDISYVLFLKYNYDFGAYDSTYAGDWYLLGASNFTARVLNIYTGKEEDVIAVNKDLKKGYAYPCINGQIVEDGKGNNKIGFDYVAPYNSFELDDDVIVHAYTSNNKYFFGSGVLGYVKDGKVVAHDLFDKKAFSKEILSPDYNAASPKKLSDSVLLKGGADDLSSENIVIYITADENGKILDWTKLGKMSELEALIADYPLTTVPYWYINTIGGSTVIYVTDGVKDLSGTGTATFSKSLKVMSSKDAEDIADLEVTVTAATTTYDGKVTGGKAKTVSFKWTGDATKDTHAAIDLDDFHFGRDGYCDKNDWDVKFSLDGINWTPLYGKISFKTYTDHADEDPCDLIQTVTIEIPETELSKTFYVQFTDTNLVTYTFTVAAKATTTDGSISYALDADKLDVFMDYTRNIWATSDGEMHLGNYPAWVDWYVDHDGIEAYGPFFMSVWEGSNWVADMITDGAINIAKGTNKTLTVALAPDFGPYFYPVEWEIKEPTIAKLDVINGRQAKISYVKEGITTLTATCGNRTVEIEVVVGDITLSVAPTTKALLWTDETLTIVPTIKLGTEDKTSALKKYLTWKSSDDTLAKVDKDGVVTPLAKGTNVIIEAKVFDKTAKCTITEIKEAATTLKLKDFDAILFLSGTDTLSEYFIKEKATADVDWTVTEVPNDSTKTPVIEIDKTTGEITAKNPGTAKITATSGTKGLKFEFSIYVNP